MTPALLVLCGCSQKPPVSAEKSQTAAIVNGEPIQLDDFYEHMMAKQTAQVLGRGGPTEQRVVGSFGLQAMQELVDQKILLQMAKEQGVLPTEADIDAELKFQQELRPDYLKVLSDQGVSLSVVRNELRIGLAREHLLMKGITVDPKEVDDYVKAHPERFGSSEKAQVLMIELNSEADKEKADAQLKAGKPFGDVAKTLSNAPGASVSGGVYPTDDVTRMPKALQDIVHKTPAKSMSEWVKVGREFYRFYVSEKQAPVSIPPTPAQRELVRRDLAMKKGTVKSDFDKLFMEKLHQSKVDVQVPAIKAPWERAGTSSLVPALLQLLRLVSSRP